MHFNSRSWSPARVGGSAIFSKTRLLNRHCPSDTTKVHGAHLHGQPVADLNLKRRLDLMTWRAGVLNHIEFVVDQ